MALIRRSIHAAAWLGTIAVALFAIGLIVSQTPWFRDWIRRAIVRQAKQYLNGELTIGQVSGNLFYGVRLTDIAVDLSGARVVSVKSLEVDYSILQLISTGIVVDRIVLQGPFVHMVRDEEGWNLGHLVKARRREADREGPGRPVSLPSLTITGGVIAIDDDVGSSTYVLPRRIEGLDVQGSFKYEPVHFAIELGQLRLQASDPDILLQQLTGKIAVRDDNVYLDGMVIHTGETALNVDGVVEQYLSTRALKLGGTGTLSLPELGRLLPAVSGYDLHPALTVKTNGTMDKLALDLDVKSEAGLVRGPIVADLRTPDLRFTGPMHVERLNLAAILRSPAQRSDITGDARIDIAIRSAPAGMPALDRIDGTFTFRGPRVLSMGYEGTRVDAAGSVKGPRITLSSARAHAYGGAATARGTIVLPSGKRAVSYDLEGTADSVDMRRLPPSIGAPRLASNFSLSAYHVSGTGRAVAGSATLKASEVEGATIHEGTLVEFETGKGPVSYGGRGSVSGLNVRRLGHALEIDVLDDPKYEGQVNGSFDVRGSGAGLKQLRLEASGTLSDTIVMGTHAPEMVFSTTIADAGLTVQANGRFEHLNPAVILDRKPLDGNVNGSVDGTFRIADLTADLTPASFSADGRVTLTPSLLGGLQIEGADVEGRYEAEVADLKRAQIKGPDVVLDASGRLALDRTSSSSLTYHIDARDISEAGAIAGQKGLDGSVVLDGMVSGNAASLEAKGTLAGNGLVWNDNKALNINSKYAVTVPDLKFDNPTVQATTVATFVQLGNRQLDQVTATTTYAQKHLEFTTKVQEKTRELEAKGRAIFHPDHQEIHLPELAVRTEGIEWRTVPGGDPAVRYGQKELTLQDIRLASGEQTLEVSGTLSLVTEQPAGTLDVRARNVDLAQVEKLLLQNRGLHGRLTADARISGSAQRPIVDGHVEVHQGGFKSYKYDSLVADVDYAGNLITLDATLQQAPGVAITARGVVPTSVFERTKAEHVTPTAEDAIDLRIQTSSLDLGVVQGLTTQLTNVGGMLTADVRVTGAGRDPHLEGFAEIRDGTFAVPRAGTSFFGLDTRIDLEPEFVRIRRFEILDENGEQLAISGQLAVHERQVGAVDITVESENFEIIDNELGDVGLGAQLKVTGQLSRPKIEGDLRIATARLEVDRILQLFYDPYRVDELPDVVSAERTAQAAGSAREATNQALAQASQRSATATGSETKPPVDAKETAAATNVFENVSLDVHLLIPDNLILRGRKLRPGGPTRASLGDINITVGGDLQVRKQPGGPVTLAGTVNTVRGTYQFQNRQFEIVRDGTLRFTGEPGFNPVLDITARRRIPDTGVEARVRITGSVTVPELQLSSTPPLEESDVLALIVFGRPLNELGSGERASLAATAGGIATGFIATPLGESVGRALDLDVFEINTLAEGESLGAEITVGKQINDRTFAKLRQQFGERTYAEFLLEYQIRDFLRLVGSIAPETTGAANRIGLRRIERAGIDLIFFFSY
jgi:autotransporter translocation and assembly factor TamB